MLAILNMSKPKGCWDCFNWDCGHWGEHGYDNLTDCPLIEIVRCGECKYYYGHEQYCEIDHFARENGFCYDGKRREDMSDISREQRLIEFLKSLPLEKRAMVVQAYVQEFGGVSIETGDIVKQLLKGE